MTEKTTAYGFGRRVKLPYATAVARVREALKAEGFGVLWEMDVCSIMKEKTGADFRPYVILGACNPPLAHRALQAELDVGLLMPCNVVVYEADGGSVIEAMDPDAVFGLTGNAELRPLALEAKERVQRALDAVAAE